MKAAEKHLPFGDILKTFGTKGELIVKLSNEAPEKINLKEPVFITIDGLPVPFYFKFFEERANDRAVVIFDDMETERIASTLVGKQLWIPYKKQLGKKEFDLNDLVGFNATDKHIGELGSIEDFFDFPNNPCFKITYKSKEILIPINENFITDIDAKLKHIELNLPKGLVDFYMNN